MIGVMGGSFECFTVLVDGEWHDLDLPGTIVHVAAPSHQNRAVRFWVWARAGAAPVTRRFRVFNTSEPLPEQLMGYHGTVHHGGGVWHLVEWPASTWEVR